MERKVLLKNSAGKRIVALINYPKTKPPFKAVIICHGFKGYKEQIHLKSLAQALARRDILAFRFDFTNGIGQSAGRLEDISYRQGLKDLRSVVDYLCLQPYINKNRLGLAGNSLGGQMALDYAPTDKRIKVLADLAGSVDWNLYPNSLAVCVSKSWETIKKDGYYSVKSRSKRKIFKINCDFFAELQKTKTIEQIKKIRQPVIIVHGTKDATVPLAQSRWCFRLLKSPKSLIVIKDAPHTWRQPLFYKKINPYVVDWFLKYL